MTDPVKLLSAEPIILERSNNHPFYVDDYTGYPTLERTGIPGILLGKVKKPNIIFGAFANPSFVRAWVDEYQTELGEERYTALCDWLDSFVGAKVWPLKFPRKHLDVFGGPWTLDQWEQQNGGFLPNKTSISVETDFEYRAAAKAEKPKRGDDPTKAPFDPSKFFMGHSQKGVTSWVVNCFAPLGLWEAKNIDPHEDAFEDLEPLAEDLGLAIPGFNQPCIPAVDWTTPVPQTLSEVPKHLRKRLQEFADPAKVREKEVKATNKTLQREAVRPKSRAPKKVQATASK